MYGKPATSRSPRPTAAPPCGASLAFPVNGATNADLTAGFSWLGVPHTTAYKMTVGTALGAADVVNTADLPATQTAVPAYDLPVGQLLYARLSTRHENVWFGSDSSFTVTTAPVGRATFIKPAADVPYVYLYVGTSPGANNVVNTGEIQGTSYVPPALPVNGNLYATLSTELAGIWRSVDRPFTALPAGACPAATSETVSGRLSQGSTASLPQYDDLDLMWLQVR